MSAILPPMAQSLKRIALVVAVATALSKLAGLVRQQAIAAAFGVGAAYDAYNYAYVLPGFLLILLGGINGPFHSAMVSVLARRPRQEGAHVLAAINTLVGAGLLVVTVVLVLLADPLITLLGPGLDATRHDIAVLQLRWMAPMALFAGLIGLGFGALNAADVFWLPSVSPLLSSVAVIGGIALLWWQLGPAILSPSTAVIGGIVLAASTTLGAVLQWLIQLPALSREGLNKLQLVWDWKDPGVREVLKVMGPATLSSGMLQINVFVDSILASFESFVGPGGQVRQHRREVPDGQIGRFGAQQSARVPGGQRHHRRQRGGIGITIRRITHQRRGWLQPGGDGEGIAPRCHLADPVPLDRHGAARLAGGTGVFLRQQQIDLGPGTLAHQAVKLAHPGRAIAFEGRTDRTQHPPIGILARPADHLGHRTDAGNVSGEGIGIKRGLGQRRAVIACIDILHQRARLGQQIAPDRREGHLARGAVDQLEAQVVLELLDASAQGRLGQVQLVSGFVEGPQFRHRDECLQAVEIDLHARVPPIRPPKRPPLLPESLALSRPFRCRRPAPRAAAGQTHARAIADRPG